MLHALGHKNFTIIFSICKFAKNSTRNNNETAQPTQKRTATQVGSRQHTEVHSAPGRPPARGGRRHPERPHPHQGEIDAAAQPAGRERHAQHPVQPPGAGRRRAVGELRRLISHLLASQNQDCVSRRRHHGHRQGLRHALDGGRPQQGRDRVQRAARLREAGQRARPHLCGASPRPRHLGPDAAGPHRQGPRQDGEQLEQDGARTQV